jgi:WD40-like Beta Propeller Repeat
MKRIASVLLVAMLIPWTSAVPAGAGDLIEPFNLEKLNTAADEDDPFVTTDNLTLYYAANANGTFGILASRRKSAKQDWPAGKVLPELTSKDADHRSPFVHKNTLFFAANEVPDPSLAKLKNYDIYQRIGEQAPIPVQGISDKTDELHPWVTPGGTELYFSRKTDEGWKLFVARGPARAPIGDARPVGFPKGFHHATLSKDALVMYLQGPIDNGGWGLYRSRRAKVGAEWSKPEALTMLNNPKGLRGDLSPCLSADGARLYFASDRPGGKGGLDLWYVPTSLLK